MAGLQRGKQSQFKKWFGDSKSEEAIWINKRSEQQEPDPEDVKAAFNHLLKAYLEGPPEERDQRLSKAYGQIHPPKKKKNHQNS
jgi:hypothetical protein